MLTKIYFLKHMVKTQGPQRRQVFILLNISFGQGFHGKGRANQKTWLACPGKKTVIYLCQICNTQDWRSSKAKNIKHYKADLQNYCNRLRNTHYELHWRPVNLLRIINVSNWREAYRVFSQSVRWYTLILPNKEDLEQETCRLLA